MPETRYVDVYDSQGNLIAQEPYEVSDEQLHDEQLTAQSNDRLHQALLALEHWATLTPAQKDLILKNLVLYVLWKEGLL